MIRNKYTHLPRLLWNEWRPLEVLKKVQETKLSRLLRHAYRNVPMYRELFDKRGVRPEDIQGLSDLSKLPIIDKKDFHEREDVEVIDRRINSPDRLLSIHTSGSSGITLRFLIDSQYDELRKAQFLRPYFSNGNKIFDRVVWFRARPTKGKRWFQRLGMLNEHQIYSGEAVQRQIQKLKQVKPHIIKGYGSVIALIASRAMEEKTELPSPRFIFTDSELLSTKTRQTIEQGFKTHVLDIYGTFETENVAYECCRHEGYHIAIDSVIMEFLKDGHPVQPGEEGEIVCTVLDNTTTPFIRYNLHDLGIYLDKKCSCGRGFPLMGILKGRTHDYAVKEDGSALSSLTIAGNLWVLSEYMHEFTIMQEAINRFELLVVPTTAYDEKGARLIKQAIWKDFPTADIQITLVERIDRDPSGKFCEFKTFFTDAIR